jgi:transposase
VKPQQQLRVLIEAATERDAQAQLLQTIPGVGPVRAAVLVAEIGALARFASRQKLRGYSGRVPRVKHSGERCWSGPRVKRGNPHLRGALVMTAGHFAASRQTRALTLRGGYRRQVYKHGPNPAKVGWARRLRDIIFASYATTWSLTRPALLPGRRPETLGPSSVSVSLCGAGAYHQQLCQSRPTI